MFTVSERAASFPHERADFCSPSGRREGRDPRRHGLPRVEDQPYNGEVPIDSRVIDLLDALPPYDESAVFTLSGRLRDYGHDPEVIAAALTQSRLRVQARTKFGARASAMLFTPDALEQASRPEASRHHAHVFAEAGVTTIREVGCGIGADTLAFVEAGFVVTARELDPERAALAAHNLQGCGNVVVETADGLTDISEEALWADPARRGPKGRITAPEKWAPPLSAVVGAARQVRAAGIKVAPGIDYSHLPGDASVEWLSSAGDLIEAIIWLGVRGPSRRAVLLGDEAVDVPGDPSRPVAMVDARDLGAYIYEPDPAVIRAGAIAVLCERWGLAPVSPGLAYLTGDTLIDSPLLDAYEVEEVLPLQEKKLARALRARGIGSLEIKKRGVDIAPDALRGRLKLRGDGSATVILTPLIAGRRAVLVRRAGRGVKGAG